MMHVQADLELSLVLGGDRTVAVPATLGYDPGEPFAVSALFRTTDGDITWVFARDLLEDGLTKPTGEGDVAIWPSVTRARKVVCLSLASPSGSALLEADHGAVRLFLDHSYALVAMGSESGALDLDHELDLLLGDEPTSSV
jgi:hypothetical protein